VLPIPACPSIRYRVRTPGGCVPAGHIPQLVSVQKSGRFGRWGCAAWESFVEVDNPLHAGGVGGTADGLQVLGSVPGASSSSRGSVILMTFD